MLNYNAKENNQKMMKKIIFLKPINSLDSQVTGMIHNSMCRNHHNHALSDFCYRKAIPVKHVGEKKP